MPTGTCASSLTGWIEPHFLETPMLEHHVDGIQAWSRETIKEEDWRLDVPNDCLLELREVVQKLELEPMPMLALTCEDYTLKACSELMRKARNRLDHGAGVVVLDRFQLKPGANPKRERCFGCWHFAR